MPKLTLAMEKALARLNDNGWHSAWGLDVSPNTLNALARRGLVEMKLSGVYSKTRLYRRKQDG